LEKTLHDNSVVEAELHERFDEAKRNQLGASKRAEIHQEEEEEKALKEANAKAGEIFISSSLVLKEEIKVYRELLARVEKRFNIQDTNKGQPQVARDSNPFPFLPPPGFDAPSDTPSNTPLTRRIFKKGSASATKKTNKSLPQTPVTPSQSISAESPHFTPTPKKRKQVDLPVCISVLDPLHQRVVIANTTDEPQDVSGWKLVNVAYAFSHQIPPDTILSPGGTFTFLPRPTSDTPKKSKRSGLRGGNKDNQSDPKPSGRSGPAPPGCAYWDVGARDIQWPMQNARAVLKDANGGVVHDFVV